MNEPTPAEPPSSGTNRLPAPERHCAASPRSPWRIRYPEELPITRHLAEIRDAWKKSQLIIVAGDTGSGKTTQLPKIALEFGWGKSGRIGCTQPRRLAASAMARRVADELGTELGAAVGYQVRFDDRTGPETVLKFMTDGILLAETRNDRALRQYSTLIIDEAHERSLNIDFLLGYLKNLLPHRPDLHVAISSATLDMESFSRFFDDAPVIAIEGRTFPVEDYYMPPELDEDQSAHIARAVEFVTELDRRGDILVFLPGEREIREAADLLTGRQLPYTEILPLFGRLAAAEQQKVFHPGNRRRIILATNVAETSVTIPRIRFVIDTGLARIKRYNPRSQVEELQIETISQASARQRRGRCGRVADGVCVHLYSEDDLERAQPYTDPEIRRTGLAGVILQMAALHLPRIDRFPFLNPPPAAAVREGIRTLEDLRALTPDGRLTREGWRLSELPIDPHLGKMLLSAERWKILPEMTVVAAYLSIQDPAERPLEKQQAADEAHHRFRDRKSDFSTILNLWNALMESGNSNRLLRNFCKRNFYNFNRMREWRNLAEDLAECCRIPLPGALAETPYDRLHQAILSGIPRHIARYVPEEQYFLGTAGRKFQLFPGSGLFKVRPVPAWILAFALVETSRLYARQNAEIKPEYLEIAAPHLCSKIYDQPYWDPAGGFVYARERLTFGGLLIHNGRRVHYAKSHPKEAREIFIREGLAAGRVEIPGSWVEFNNLLLAELKELEERIRRPGTVLDTEAVVEHYLKVLPEEIHSVQALKELLKRDTHDYSVSEDEAMQEQFRELRPADYPDKLTFSGHPFRLRYRFAPGEEDDGVTLEAKESELNLLPEWALDYVVAGYLPEKILLMLRSLPKALRQAASPLQRTADEFCVALEKKSVFGEQPLVCALAEYLRNVCGEPVAPDDFHEPRFPEYLMMKLAVLDERGRRKELLREIPATFKRGSRLSCAVAGAGNFTVSGRAEWPGTGVLPREVELPKSGGKRAYPALCDEGESVGMALYLKENEAAFHHRKGILRLFKLGNAAQVKFLKRSIRLERAIELSWFLTYRDYADDLLDAAIAASLGVDCSEIRDAASCATALEQAKQECGETLDQLLGTLRKLHESSAPIYELLRRTDARSRESTSDLKRHLNFLFRNHFLRSNAVFEEYSRYLRGARLRAERIHSAPARDEAKLEPIAPYIERFHLAAADREITETPALHDFWLLLEECRLATFAPEIPLKIRAPLKRLAPAWEELRF